MDRKNVSLWLVMIILLLVFTAGCGKQPKENSANSPEESPVTLTFYKYYVGLTDSQFDQYFVQPVKQKFPNVTLKFVSGALTGPTAPENIIASGENPDLIFTSNYSLDIFKQLQMSAPLNDLIKKSNFDFNRFEPTMIDALKKYSDHGETDAVPFSMNFAALYYNKDIFDKFGVAYPKELSTWDDVIELSKKLTRSEGGVQYLGILPPNAKQFGDQLSLTYADQTTNKATIDTEQWKYVLGLMKQFYNVPGILGNDGKIPPIRPLFLNDKRMAMFADWADGMTGGLEDLEQKGQPLNWDMTTYPSYKDKPGKGRAVDFHILMVSNTSKHKDLVFNIINYLTTDGPQLEMTKNGRMTALNNNEIKKNYGAHLKSMQGRNLTAVLKSKPTAIQPTDYDVIVSNLLNTAANQVFTGKKDMNTALRETQEAADKAISEALTK